MEYTLFILLFIGFLVWIFMSGDGLGTLGCMAAIVVFFVVLMVLGFAAGVMLGGI